MDDDRLRKEKQRDSDAGAEEGMRRDVVASSNERILTLDEVVGKSNGREGLVLDTR